MTRPDFLEMARAWLVRAQGHARPANEQSLAAEFERAWELGVANAIEALPSPPETGLDDSEYAGFSIGVDAAETAIRRLTDKPTDSRGN